MQTKVTYDSAAATFTMVKGIWSGTFPIADLSKWLEFYRDQQRRYPAQALSYGEDVKALEALAAQLR